MLLHVLILSWSCPSFSIRNVLFCFEVDFEFVRICGCALKKERKKVSCHAITTIYKIQTSEGLCNIKCP